MNLDINSITQFQVTNFGILVDLAQERTELFLARGTLDGNEVTVIVGMFKNDGVGPEYSDEFVPLAILPDANDIARIQFPKMGE